jgi:hypothetical protein
MLALCAMVLATQAAPAQRSKAGQIIGSRLRTPEPFNLVLIPAELKPAVTANMQSLYDIVRRDTMFYEPVAFEAQPTAHMYRTPRPGFAYLPVDYHTPRFMIAYGPDTPATAPGWRTITRTFYVQGNGLASIFTQGAKWQDDDKGTMYWEPPRLPDVAGFPAYGKGLVVVTRNERPLYVPAPLERTMKLVIANLKKGIDGMNSPFQQKMVDRTKACITKLEAALAALSPADRAGPTYMTVVPLPGRDPVCDSFASASDRGARRIVVENPDFYDTKKPPSAIQVVFVIFDYDATVPAVRPQVDRIAKQLDWAALAALTTK